MTQTSKMSPCPFPPKPHKEKTWFRHATKTTNIPLQRPHPAAHLDRSPSPGPAASFYWEPGKKADASIFYWCILCRAKTDDWTTTRRIKVWQNCDVLFICSLNIYIYPMNNYIPNNVTLRFPWHDGVVQKPRFNPTMPKFCSLALVQFIELHTII